MVSSGQSTCESSHETKGNNMNCNRPSPPISHMKTNMYKTFDQKEIQQNQVPQMKQSPFQRIHNPNYHHSNPLHHTIQSIAVHSIEQDVLSRLTALHALYTEGFIDRDDYEQRKMSILDQVTQLSLESIVSSAERAAIIVRSRSRNSTLYSSRSTAVEPSSAPLPGLLKSAHGCPQVIFSRPPSFEYLPEENAIRHTFNYDLMKWECRPVRIKLDRHPFARGSLRLAYHLQHLEDSPLSPRINIVDGTPGAVTYVAKVAIDPEEDPQTYFRDIELQAHCAYYAQLYNEHNPPKKVQFVKAWVLELTDRGGSLLAVEQYIDGVYKKHNNNYGCVSEDDRNTPQAFSHFTYEASKHKLLAVDIQGVGDLYTDPQIHTINGDDFGKGNLGKTGIQKFLSSHRCNPICEYLKLPSINPKENNSGTVPMQRFMQKKSIRAVQFESRHYYESAPMLQKYVAQCREHERLAAQNWDFVTCSIRCCDQSSHSCTIQ